MKDFIIVGAGLAGISFAETAYANGKSFMIVSDRSQQSSFVAAGLYNPVILKRLSMPQDAAEHLAFIRPFYKKIEERLGIKCDYPMPIYRKFASVEEQNDWFAAADKPALEPFLSTRIMRPDYSCIPAAFGFGLVLQTGYIDTTTLIEAYLERLRETGSYLEETFDHNSLVLDNKGVAYKGISARHTVFAEGFGICNNPFFSQLPLNGTKGEILVIRAPQLQLDVIIKAGLFILPVGNDIYKVGATYEWDDKTNSPSTAARETLVKGLEEVITCKYEIVGQLAGVRPTTKDRKPLIGTHPDHKTVHLLNGLGTRGVMLGPPMAKELFDSIACGKPVRKEVGLQRFLK